MSLRSIRYPISSFSLQLRHLDSNLDTLIMDWTSSMGTRNSTNFELVNLLVPLTILSHNHQNYNYSLMKPYFLHPPPATTHYTKNSSFVLAKFIFVGPRQTNENKYIISSALEGRQNYTLFSSADDLLSSVWPRPTKVTLFSSAQLATKLYLYYVYVIC
jgi:hypothetical protein